MKEEEKKSPDTSKKNAYKILNHEKIIVVEWSSLYRAIRVRGQAMEPR